MFDANITLSSLFLLNLENEIILNMFQNFKSYFENLHFQEGPLQTNVSSLKMLF